MPNFFSSFDTTSYLLFFHPSSSIRTRLERCLLNPIHRRGAVRLLAYQVRLSGSCSSARVLTQQSIYRPRASDRATRTFPFTFTARASAISQDSIHAHRHSPPAGTRSTAAKSDQSNFIAAIPAPATDTSVPGIFIQQAWTTVFPGRPRSRARAQRVGLRTACDPP